MTAVYVWLASKMRHLAQWLDPLPDAVSELQALVESMRNDLVVAHETHTRFAGEHDKAMDALRDALVTEQTAFGAFQQLHATCVPVKHDALYESAVRLTREWEDREVNGAFKRHQVLAVLQDLHPERSGRDRALAIEAALWR